MVTTPVSAQDLFRAAYENRYTWDSAFPGYTATVTYRNGDRTVSGKVTVSADLKPSVEGVTDEADVKAIHGQLFEVAIHRVRRSFEQTHGQNSFRYGEVRPDGSQEILLGGKAEGDRYEVRDNEVTMVHRHIHGVVVTIHTESSHQTGQGYLSHRYDSVYADPATGEQKGGRNQFEDEYEPVGDYWLLKRRAIHTELDGAVSEQEFSFSDFALLSA